MAKHYRQNTSYKAIMDEEGEEPQGGASFIREYRLALRAL